MPDGRLCVGDSILHRAQEALNLLKNAASNAESVSISFTDSNACFTFDEALILCRLIEGKYPNYEAVIPKDNPNRMTINRTVFSSLFEGQRFCE